MHFEDTEDGTARSSHNKIRRRLSTVQRHGRVGAGPSTSLEWAQLDPPDHATPGGSAQGHRPVWNGRNSTGRSQASGNTSGACPSAVIVDGVAVLNPFVASFGVVPPELAGRVHVINEFDLGLEGPAGNSNRVMLLIGERGMGKTVLLETVEQRARALGWIAVTASASPASGFVERLTSAVQERLEEQAGWWRQIAGEPPPRSWSVGYFWLACS